VRRIVVAAAVVAALLWWWLRAGGPAVEPGSVLLVDLSGSFVEAAEPPLLARLLGDSRQSFTALLSDLRKAERDERIAGVLFRVRGLGIGWAKAQELRAAIQRLGRAGRRTLAYLELGMGSNLEYYVATGAGEIRASPVSASPLVGLGAEYLFLGGLWEKLGAGFEVEGVGEYKSAVETLTGTKMSPAHREMAASLLDSTDAQFVAGIAEGRRLPEPAVRRAIDEGAASPESLRELGLVDAVCHFDEALESLGGGPLLEREDYAQVDPKSVGFDPVAKFALVYGAGAVSLGAASPSPTGAMRMTSDDLSEALEEIAKDDEIRAVLLRIDSPGGSAQAAEVIWRATRRARESGKPVVASVSDLAASGGYYVAAAADAIVAPPASQVGSIGVFVMRPVLGELLGRLGIGVESMTRGAHADLMLVSQPLSESTRAHLRAEIESTYELFLDRVAEGRALPRERVHELARGRVWTGAQAAENGLVDALGGLREAVDEARELAGLAPDADVALVPYPRVRTLLEEAQDALRRASLAAWPPLPVPPGARELAEWLAAVPPGTPGLLPPLLIEIR
jgi:protease-4